MLQYMSTGAAKFNQDLSGWDVDSVASSYNFGAGATAWEASHKPQFSN